jgi:mRNA interferase HigB
MRVISLKALREFWRRHPDAEQALRNWHTLAEHSEFANFAELRRIFGSVDYVSPHTIFDIGGNRYTLITIVRYRDRKIFIREVMSHREYDDWCKSRRRAV